MKNKEKPSFNHYFSITPFHNVFCLSIISIYLVAQTVKNLPAVQETWVWSLGWEDLLEKGMVTHSSILARKIPWTEEPQGLHSGIAKNPTGLSTETQALHASIRKRKEWNFIFCGERMGVVMRTTYSWQMRELGFIWTALLVLHFSYLPRHGSTLL